jgi:hypothetical protein
MKTAFQRDTASWKIKWPERISRHDLVYLSPPSDPMEGIALGNGDVGALVWCESSKLICVLNKCDLWDDAKFTEFTNWKTSEEDTSTTLRHAGRLIIDFKIPVFDKFYLQDFDCRLSLSDAALVLKAKSVYGTVSLRGFVDSDTGVFCIDMKTNFNDAIPCEIIMERYGSRTFSHWYRLINRDARIGSAGTESFANENSIYIEQKISSGRFGIGCRVEASKHLKIETDRIHAHAAHICVPAKRDVLIKLFASVTSPMAKNCLAEVSESLRRAKTKGLNLFKKHKKNWKAFWLRSLMESGDDYLDNLWHLTMYYANSSQRGKYPGRFISGLWNWSRDAQSWNFYFHWNQQQVYWPLNAAGHHDLIDSYLDYRFNALPHSRKTAKELGLDGAFVSDVTERRGYNSFEELKNHTPVTQIAMDFWRQYMYTGDTTFLKERVVPYITQAAKYFASFFEKCPDGKYHAKCGTGYEGWIELKDSITELVAAKVLFATAYKAIEIAGSYEPQAEKWRQIANNLAELPIIKTHDMIVNANGMFTIQCGMFKGEKAYSNKIFASGQEIKSRKFVNSFHKNASNNIEHKLETAQELLKKFNRFEPINAIKPDDLATYDGIFPWCELSTVFPSGLIGLNSINKEQFKVAVDTAKLFTISGMGWDITPIVLARLGLRQELAKLLHEHVNKWQFFNNGWGHYGPFMPGRIESSLPFASKIVLDSSVPDADKIIHGKKPERPQDVFEFRLWPFRHMGMEAMSVLACAMNESLLQSHDGILNIAPSCSSKAQCRFTLHACGGFIVSAEIETGKPCWISIKSVLGQRCRVKNPWQNAFLFSSKGRMLLASDSNEFEFDTRKDQVYTIVPRKQIMKKWCAEVIKYKKNMNVKKDLGGIASLGLPRMF